MKKIIKTTFLILFLSVFAISTASAIDFEKCKSCHATVKPLTIITKDCLKCHSGHNAGQFGQPQERDSIFVHNRHQDVNEGKQDFCKNCHSSPVDCTNCHNTHEINLPVKTNINDIKSNANDITSINYSMCASSCHGALPNPYGHPDFRAALKESKHNWMNCGTCHVSPYSDSNQINLHFKNLMETPINYSINLCRICHSLQYNGLKDGTHGEVNKTCINCHNPHTTQFGQNIKITPKPTPVNIANTLNSTTNWITKKVPILNNPFAVVIILVLFSVSIAEYVLSKHEEGKKIAYNMVRVQADENTLKTLEIKLENQNFNIINDVLKESDINILGMTMSRETNLYKYIVFIECRLMNEEDLINKLSLINNVKSVEITDKYEL